MTTIDEKLQAAAANIGNGLDHTLQALTGEHVGFMLLLVPQGTGETGRIISNLVRSDWPTAVRMMEQISAPEAAANAAPEVIPSKPH